MTEHLFFALVALVLGLCVGSFLNVVIHRLPKMLERRWQRRLRRAGAASRPPDGRATTSSCRARPARPAATGSRALENIPVRLLARAARQVLGLQGARSRPATRWSSSWAACSPPPRSGASAPRRRASPPRLPVDAAGADLHRLRHPAAARRPDAAAAVGRAARQPVRRCSRRCRTRSIGAIAGYLALWSIYWLFKLIRGKEGMGYGDFKLLAALGAWLGWQMLPLIVLLSSVVGAVIGIALIVFKGRDHNIPLAFGPVPRDRRARSRCSSAPSLFPARSCR